MKNTFITAIGCLFVFLLTAAMKRDKTVSAFISTDSLPEIKTVALDTSGIASKNDIAVFTNVEVDASFHGGEKGWIEFVQRNLKANVPARKKAPAGSYLVVVQFKIDKQGKLSVIEPVTSHGYGMEQEVIRVLKKSPDWRPATQNGNPINAYRKQPITFIVGK